MKEGYFQNKLTTFSETLSSFEKKLALAETEYNRMQMQLGEFKQLIKKLKDIESYQNKAISKIQKENMNQINEIIQETSHKLEKSVKKTIDRQSELLSGTLEQIKSDEKIFKNSLELIQSFELKINYYQEYNHLLMLKLINKGILNNQEINEIGLRAKKRVKTK